MKTIPRNHKRKVEDIKAKAVRCRVLSLANDFGGKSCDPAVAWEALATYDFARLVEHENKWTVDVHSNLWYELFAA